LFFAIEPLVKNLTKLTVFNKPLSRSLAVIIAYVFVIIILGVVLTVGLPPVISQLQKMVTTLSQMAKNLNLTQADAISLTDFLPQATSFSSEFLSVTVSIFSNITSLFSLFILSIYMSLDWKNLKKKFIDLFPSKIEDEVEDTVQEVEATMGQWVKGQLVLMTVVGVMCTVGLVILDVDYALALGIISGILEIVPMIGPIISAVLAGIIGFTDTPVKGMGVIALYLIVQQLENNILVPKIMQKVSGFSPLVILIALLIGSEFFGVIGALMAVPMTMILAIILKRVLRDQDF
jgi:predicted PurR-regulated permease PerM